MSTGRQQILTGIPTHQVKNSSQNFIHCLNLLRFEADHFHGISYYFEFCSVIDRRLGMKMENLSTDLSSEHYNPTITKLNSSLAKVLVLLSYVNERPEKIKMISKTEHHSAHTMPTAIPQNKCHLFSGTFSEEASHELAQKS